ncbi:hypothetical protein H0H92_003666 [Tricholoma furcatifolium]|nr:hypothetical protein H0H92_003666 [Tricholoma furcatifolium]
MPNCLFCSKFYESLKGASNHQRRCPKGRKAVLSASRRPTDALLGAPVASTSKLDSLEVNNAACQIEETENQAEVTPTNPNTIPEVELGHIEQVDDNVRRTRRPPAHLVDYLPSETRSTRPLRQFHEIYERQADLRENKRRCIEPPPVEPPPLPPTTTDTECDEMGLFRQYTVLPARRDPDEGATIYDVSDAPTFLIPDSEPRNPLSGFGPIDQDLVQQPTTSNISFFYPFLNASVFRLMSWYYATKSLTLAALDRLVYTVIQAPDFSRCNFDDFNVARENQRLADSPADGTSKAGTSNSSAPWMDSDVWRKASISIPLPRTRMSFKTENTVPSMTIDFYHRDILEVFKSVAQNVASSGHIHWQGFQQFWKPSDDEPEQRVYGKVYTSDAFLGLQQDIPPSEDGLETVAFWNCITLASHIWFGGFSKYVRGTLNSFTANHLAYFPSLPDLAQEVYQRNFGINASSSLLAHLKRELIHGAWKIILTDEFKEVYRNGIILVCGDGIRPITSSALIACIKQMGTYLCATCRIMKAQIRRLGTRLHDIIWSRKYQTDNSVHAAKIQKARKVIFRKGYAATGKAIDRMLGESFVPIENAFSSLLLSTKQNYFDLFVPDIMHEIELGVWKQIFTHLIRMLQTYGSSSVTKLDSRYRLIMPFGHSTIRKFHNNVSELKSFSALNYEDLLQCAGPCFDGLFCQTSRSVDRKVQDLLFALASWHASAKMRLHTDWSLKIFEGLTIKLTRQIHIFATQVCPKFETHQTPKESHARLSRKAKTAKSDAHNEAAEPAQQRLRTFNYDTPKMHSIVHYPRAIRKYGTTDSYSTQIV